MQQYKSDNELIFEAYNNQVICNEWVGLVGRLAWPVIRKAGINICKWLFSSKGAATIAAVGAADVLMDTGDAIESVGSGVESMLGGIGMQIGLALAGVILAGAGLFYVYKLLKSSDTIQDAKNKSTDEETTKLLDAIDKLDLDGNVKMKLLSSLISKHHNKLESLAKSN